MMTEKRTKVACHFANEDQLYKAYMPFVRTGGLFIRTKHSFRLGDEVLLSVKIMNMDDVPLKCEIVWLTPDGAQGNKPAGFGAKFPENKEARDLRQKIETILAGKLESSLPTDTF